MKSSQKLVGKFWNLKIKKKSFCLLNKVYSIIYNTKILPLSYKYFFGTAMVVQHSGAFTQFTVILTCAFLPSLSKSASPLCTYNISCKGEWYEGKSGGFYSQKFLVFIATIFQVWVKIRAPGLISKSFDSLAYLPRSPDNIIENSAVHLPTFSSTLGKTVHCIPFASVLTIHTANTDSCTFTISTR